MVRQTEEYHAQTFMSFDVRNLGCVLDSLALADIGVIYPSDRILHARRSCACLYQSFVAR